MATHQKDILLFRFFDLVAKWAKPISNEWFKLMEWLLVISALSFASKISDDFYVKLLYIISIVILSIYLLFGYCQLYFESIRPFEFDPYQLSTRRFLILLAKLVATGAIVLIGILFFSQKMIQIAFEFAFKLSDKLK